MNRRQLKRLFITHISDPTKAAVYGSRLGKARASKSVSKPTDSNAKKPKPASLSPASVASSASRTPTLHQVWPADKLRVITPTNLTEASRRIGLSQVLLEYVVSHLATNATPGWIISFIDRRFFITSKGPVWIVDAVACGQLNISTELEKATRILKNKSDGTWCMVNNVPFVSIASQIVLLDEALAKHWIHSDLLRPV